MSKEFHITCNPIGVFDSGMGGLSVVKTLKKYLPNEQIIYYGDTAHLPYGDKSPEDIYKYSKRIVEFLLVKNCKAIVVACNSASSNALDRLKTILPYEVELFDVINPFINYFKNKNYKKIGLIATRATVNSGIYSKLIKAQVPNLHLVELSTPMLVPMIEEGFINCGISDLILRAYLNQDIFEQIEALILACTHYPILKEEIKEFYKGKVEIIESSKLLAKEIYQKLKDKNLLNKDLKKEDQFFISSYLPFFEKQAKIFFGEDISLKIHSF